MGKVDEKRRQRYSPGCRRRQGKIKVEAVKDSASLIKIEDGDPNRAALLVNEVAQAYSDEVMARS